MAKALSASVKVLLIVVVVTALLLLCAEHVSLMWGPVAAVFAQQCRSVTVPGDFAARPRHK